MTSESNGGIGHNQIRAFVERIERLEEEKAGLSGDIRDVYAEAKGQGFDVKALREIIRLRRKDTDELKEHEAVVDTYKAALGMLSDTPLGQAAIKSAEAQQPKRPRGRPRKEAPKPDVPAEREPQDTSDRPFSPPDEPRQADGGDPLDIPADLRRA